MKKAIKIMALSAIILSSCSKDIEICVDGEMNPAEPGQYTYTWCGTNADHVVWNVNGIKYAGESINMDFAQKISYVIGVEASNKRKEKTQNFEINVGTYQARVEPKDCGGGGYVTFTNASLKTYLYADLANLQVDLKNNDKNNCIDSITLALSDFYQGTTDHGTGGDAYVGAFESIPSGNYVVYVTETGTTYPKNNLEDIFLYGGGFQVNNGTWDDICTPTISNLSADYFKNFISKTYQLTGVSVNGASISVAPCNADDKISFNLDGTWNHDVGSDDCSGGQTSGSGTYAGVYPCYNVSSSSLYMNASSGSFSTSGSLYVQITSATQIKVSLYEGTNFIEQVYTAQ